MTVPEQDKKESPKTAAPFRHHDSPVTMSGDDAPFETEEHSVAGDIAAKSSAASDGSDGTSTRRHRHGRVTRSSIIMLWLMLLVIASVLTYVALRDSANNDKAVALAQRLATLEREAQSLSDEMQKHAFDPMQQHLSALDADVKQLKNDNEINKRYYSQRPLVGDDVLMYEIEYRVRFAEQQLMVGNADNALTMLAKAEDDLAALKRLDLANVRIQLNRNLEELRGTPPFDGRVYIDRIDRSLNVIQNMTPYAIPESMPRQTVGSQLSPEDAKLPAWQRWFKSVEGAAKSVVRIRVGEKAREQHAVLVDAAMDRQELRLRLLSLRLMVMIRSPAARVEAISLNGWLTQRFDESNPEVHDLQLLLSDIAESAIVTPLPDIKNTLTAIRNWRAAQR